MSEHEISEYPLRPVRKKETAKAWILTLVLHFLIAGGLISYWYFYQRPQANVANVPLAVSLPTATPTNTPASTLTTLSSVITVSTASQTMMTASPASLTSKPLAEYLAKQQATQPATGAVLPVNGITTVQMPATVMQQKVITHDAPIKKALTERDIAKNEDSHNGQADIEIAQVNERANALQQADNTDNRPTSPVDAPVAKGDVAEKEASMLSKDIEADNEKLSQLIEQVKVKNQRQIETSSGGKSAVDESAEKPASSP